MNIYALKSKLSDDFRSTTKFMGLSAVPRSLKNSFIILSTPYNMVYILIYKTSLTIEDSFCVQERVRIFIASQLKNLISKVSNIGMQ